MAEKIVVIGAGLSGLACALYLARRGYNVEVFESKSSDEISGSKRQHRSMSIDLSARGIYALKELLVYESIMEDAVPMIYKIFHAKDGSLTHIAYGRHDAEYISSVSRDHIFNCLIDACLNKENIRVNFNSDFLSMDFGDLSFSINNKVTKKISTLKADIIIGADGGNSRVRRLCENYRGVNFENTVFKHAYKELSIPKERGLELEYNAMHLWSRDKFMLLAHPNRDYSFTGALLMPEHDHERSFASLKSKADLMALFEHHFADALSLMPNLCEDFQNNPLGRLRVLKGYPWSINGNVVLIGDAAHGMLPFFGQGINCSLEDTTVLNECLNESQDHWPRALSLFNERRVDNGHAITAMSHDNYPELHHSSVMRRVLLKKQIDAFLGKKYPSVYTGYHHLVCFERVPYLYALQCKKLQEPLLDKLCEGINAVDDLDWQRVDRLMSSYRDDLGSLNASPNT